jgi:5-methylcytosine-specific restriction protein A
MKLKSLRPRVQTLAPKVRTTATSWRGGTTGANARGYTYRWQQARKRHLDLHPLCVMCEADGRVALATVVDHREPHRGDLVLFWNPDNWQALCKRCHDSCKQSQERHA